MSVNDQQLTEWFDGKTTVPGQSGVYRRNPYYSHWNGKFWGLRCADVDTAYELRAAPSIHQDLPWRGLLEEHK